MNESRQVAQTICEDLLHRSGTALITGDFALFESCFQLPQVIETFHGERRVENAADLKDVFEGMRAHFKMMGVTDIDRRCVGAVYINDDTIETTHETRLLNKAIMLRRPYPVFSVVRQIDGMWKVTHGKYAVDDMPALRPVETDVA